MATESNRIIFNVPKAPSAKSILVSIPMNMYRIKTNKFDYGLDFFQKAIIMLKANPEVTVSTISACLGLEEDLIERIIRELVINEYLNNSGMLTKKGLDKKRDIDGLVINPKEQEIGYVFQYQDRNEFYPYYVKDLGNMPNLSNRDEIIIGTKGDGRENCRKPFQMDFISAKKRVMPFPNEAVLFDIIAKTSRKIIAKTSRKDDIFTHMPMSQLRKTLSVSYLHDTPEPIPVDVCTYVYLPKREEDDLYEPDWQILDPFGYGDSSQLKFYIESFHDDSFRNEIEHRFSDARTIASKNFGDYNIFLTQEVERMKESDFGVEFRRLDKNLQSYLDSAIKNMFLFRQYRYDDFDSGDMFIISTQKALETLFLIDAERRKDIYDEMKEDFSTPDKTSPEAYYHKRRDFLKDLTRNHLINITEPERLIRLSKKVEPNRSSSLKQYIYNLILTYNYDNQSPLFKLIDGNIEKLFDIAELRNSKGHGQTENEGAIAKLAKDVAEDSYAFLQEFINKYLTIGL